MGRTVGRAEIDEDEGEVPEANAKPAPAPKQ
jgi:hypothetical protein